MVIENFKNSVGERTYTAMRPAVIAYQQDITKQPSIRHVHVQRQCLSGFHRRVAKMREEPLLVGPLQNPHWFQFQEIPASYKLTQDDRLFLKTFHRWTSQERNSIRHRDIDETWEQAEERILSSLYDQVTFASELGAIAHRRLTRRIMPKNVLKFWIMDVGRGEGGSKKGDGPAAFNPEFDLERFDIVFNKFVKEFYIEHEKHRMPRLQSLLEKLVDERPISLPRDTPERQQRPTCKHANGGQFKAAHGIAPLATTKLIRQLALLGNRAGPVPMQVWSLHPELYTPQMFDHDCANVGQTRESQIQKLEHFGVSRSADWVKYLLSGDKCICKMCTGQDEIAKTSGEAKMPGPHGQDTIAMTSGEAKNPGPGNGKGKASQSKKHIKAEVKKDVAAEMKKHKVNKQQRRPKQPKTKKKTPTAIGNRRAIIPGVVKASSSDVGQETLFRGVDETLRNFEAPMFTYNTTSPVAILPVSLEGIAELIKIQQPANPKAVPDDLVSLLQGYSRVQWGHLRFRYESRLSNFKGGSIALLYVPLESDTSPSSANVQDILDTSIQTKRRDHIIVPTTRKVAAFTIPEIGGSRAIRGPSSLIGHLCIFMREPIMQANTTGEATDQPYQGIVGTIHVDFKGLGQYKTKVDSPDNQLFSAEEYPLIATPVYTSLYSTHIGSNARVTMLNTVLPPNLARAVANKLQGPGTSGDAPQFFQYTIKRAGTPLVVEVPIALIPILEFLATGIGLPPGVATLCAKGVVGIWNLGEFIMSQFEDKVAASITANGQNQAGICVGTGGITTESGIITSVIHQPPSQRKGTVTWTPAFNQFLTELQNNPTTNALYNFVIQLYNQGFVPLGMSWPDGTETPSEELVSTIFVSNSESYPVVKTVPPAISTSAEPLTNDLFGIPWNFVTATDDDGWSPVEIGADSIPSRVVPPDALYLVCHTAIDSYSWVLGTNFYFAYLDYSSSAPAGGMRYVIIDHTLWTSPTYKYIENLLNIKRWSRASDNSLHATFELAYMCVGATSAFGTTPFSADTDPMSGNNNPNPQGSGIFSISISSMGSGADVYLSNACENMLMHADDHTFHNLPFYIDTDCIFRIVPDF